MRRKVTIDEMRSIQLDILDIIHKFCIEKGIRYSLGGGTLLGAVRHKGYIPWDDDIDIMMPRPDYERFLKEFEGLHPHYTVQHYKNNLSYSNPFAKIYDNRTKLVEGTLITGVAIDIFPIDGLPVEEFLDEYMMKYQFLARLIYRATKAPLNIFALKKRVVYLMYKLCQIDRNISVQLLELLANSYPFEISEFAGAIVGRYGEKEHMTSDVFKSYIDLPFEGKQYKAIAAYDWYLRKHYGDYMKLPPKDKQVSWHIYKVWWK